MSKMFSKTGMGLLVFASLALPLAADVPATKLLSGHVPSIVAHLAKTGDVAATNHLHLAIGLQLRNQAALDALVQSVGDPASTNYGHYLTPEQFTQQFAPTEADYQAVVDFARAQGLQVTAKAANRLLVEVDAQADKVQNAFKVSLHTYQHPTENRTFFAPDSEPSVPSNLPILNIGGLSSYARPINHLHVRSSLTNSVAGNNVSKAARANKSNTGAGPIGSYMGADFRAAYAPGASQTGSGQTVALVQFNGYFASDIQLYEALNNLPTVPLTNVLLSGFAGAPIFNGQEGEVSLDIEMVVSMAPGLNQVRVYEGNPYNFLPDVLLNQIAVDDAASQISSSWSWTGGPDAVADQIFKEMILQGQTYYNASGDLDAFLPGEVDSAGYDGFPCSDPYVTEVGATTLTTAGPAGAFVSETVWNWDVEYGSAYDGVGSCGGVSSYYTIPWWQTNINMTINGGSTTYRNIPDVAMVGDNVLIITDGGVEQIVGGTSCAAPLWAGFTSLINQQAAAVGHSVVGFINPSLYALASSKYYNSVLNDVTTGNNTWSLSPTNYYATTNYDLCTGLGSPNGTNLIYALTSVTNVTVSIAGLIPAPLQPWGNSLLNVNGSDPNGLWLLYIQDDTLNHLSGTNYNGWFVSLTTANPVANAADNQVYASSSVNGVAYGNATNVITPLGALWSTTLAVTNYGPSTSSNVYVSDAWPISAGLTLVTNTLTKGTLSNFGENLIWNVGNLPINSGATLTLNFKVTALGAYTNTATVSATTTDPNPDDDSVSVIASGAPLTSPTIVPRLVAGTSNHGFQLSIASDAGSTVVIQASTNLINWVNVSTGVSPYVFTNFDTTNFQQRFYRAVVGQ